MSSELDDAKEFAEASENGKPEPAGRSRALAPKGEEVWETESDKDEPKPGAPSQYALFADGYMPTTPTVKHLPPGCYNIIATQQGIYAAPTPKPSGILLELPEMRSERVISIVETFWASEKDYKLGNDFVIGGAQYKAGIMIFGPPGTGKSCTIKLVSNKLVELGGTVFYASGRPSTISSFLNEFTQIERDRKCIVILEDIDSLISNFGESDYLEMLDSAKTIDNVLFIATTNYPERLDPRIYNRPGRFSHMVKIGLPKAAARRAYLKAILKKHDHVETIVDNTEGFTIDHLTAIVNAVYREKKELLPEIERLRTLFKVPRADESKPLGISNSKAVTNDDE